MRGNPSGNFVPECEPRKNFGVKLEVLRYWMPRAAARIQQTAQTLSLTCPRLDLLYQNTLRRASGESKKLLEVHSALPKSRLSLEIRAFRTMNRGLQGCDRSSSASDSVPLSCDFQ